MSAKEILYVSYRDEALAEGVTYAIYLASTLHEGLRVVLINHDDAKQKVGDSLAAAAFAEAGEFDTARELISGGGGDSEAARAQSYIFERCRKEGIKVTVHSGVETGTGAVRNIINRKKIDLVLLSPLVSHTRKLLKKMMQFSSRPVVTMAETSGYQDTLEGGN